MAKKLSTYQKLQRSYVKKTSSLYSKNEGKEVFDMLSKGENKYLKLNRMETSSMDMTWIKRIEDCLGPIGEIVQNPKKTIQTLTEVVQVEKVKKIGTETVQHLSSHTQFIKTVDENGNVTPSKLLNVFNDDYYAIYENKFIATLLRHLIVFVEKRYEFVMQQAKMTDVSLLWAKNRTQVGDAVIEIETKVRYSQPAEQAAADKLKGYIKQIKDIRKYLKFYMRSEFMNILRREKDVRNPILQTNIIRKNPKYHKCYLLWLFIERYREAGIEAKVEENYADLTKQEIEELNQVMCSNFLALKGKDFEKSNKKQKVYKPKILNTYDDVIFKPAYYDGPIEYIRVDDKYREYSESLHDLPLHPTRKVAEYEEERYQENKATREKTKQIDSLLKRKEAEKANYEKQEALAEIREKEKDEYIKARAEKEIREEAIEKVEKARKELIKKAKKASTKKAKPELKKEEPKKEEAKPEVKVEEPKPKVEPKKEVKAEQPKPKKAKPKAAPKKVSKPKKQVEEKKEEPKQEVKPEVKVEKPKAEPKKAEPKVAPKKAVKKAEPKKEVKVEKPKPAPKKVVKPKEQPKEKKVEPKVQAKPVVKQEEPRQVNKPFVLIGNYRNKVK